MKGNEIFGGKTLKAADLGNAQPIVTIESVRSHKFDDGTKAVIKFQGKDKELVCNKTNWNSIVEITGEEDSDNWTGHRIKLTVAKVDYQGQRVPAIRVEDPGTSNGRAKPAPVPPPNDDEIPF